MTLRTGLITAIAGLTLAACEGHPSNNGLESAVTTPQQAAVASEAPKPEEGIWREYGVFATDDAPVNNPELADAYFDGMRLADCPYRPYSEKNRIRGDKFRIGQLPDGILESGPNDDLVGMLRIATSGNSRFGSEKNLRVAIIFTGEQFASQADDALKYIPPGRTTLNGQEFQTYRTKTGLFYQTTLESGNQLGILICGHETF